MMPVWVKAEGAPDSEAFRVDVPSHASHVHHDVANRSGEAGSSASSPPEDISEPSLHDVLKAAVQLFFPGGGSKRAASATDASRYVLCLSGHVLRNLNLPAQQVVADALKTALDVRQTVVNRDGTMSQFMLLRRQGIVFELRHAKPAHKRLRRSPVPTSPADTGRLSRPPTETECDRGVSATGSAEPCVSSSLSGAVLWSPRQVTEKVLPTRACNAFQPRWGAPAVCDVCMQHVSSHGSSTIHNNNRRGDDKKCMSLSPARQLLPQSPLSSILPNRSGGVSPASPPSSGDQAMVCKSAYTRTCNAFVPLWDHNDHCSNCYRPLHWHASYLDDLAQKKRAYMRAIRGQASSRVHHRQVLMLPWHAIFYFLQVEDVMACGCCCRTLALTARVLLKAIMALVLRHEPPPDVKMRILRDADRIRQSLQGAAKTSMVAAKALVAIVACTRLDNTLEGPSSRHALELPSSQQALDATALEGHNEDAITRSPSNRLYHTNDDEHLNDGDGFDDDDRAPQHHPTHQLTARIHQLLTLDVRTLSADALDALRDIPSHAPSNDPSSHVRLSSLFITASHDAEPTSSANAHRSHTRTTNHQQPNEHTDNVHRIVTYLRNMLNHRAMKDKAAHYLEQPFVAL